MMKKLILPIAILTLLGTIAQASLSIGISLLFDKNDLGSEIGFAPKIGWQLTDNDYFNHSLEAEVDFLNMEGKEDGVNYDGRATPVLFNYRLSWNPNDIFGLYAGAGIGFSSNNMDNGTTDESATDFAWQFQLGTNLTFAESYNINLGYRHLDTSEINNVDGGHNIIDLGFRYQF